MPLGSNIHTYASRQDMPISGQSKTLEILKDMTAIEYK